MKPERPSQPPVTQPPDPHPRKPALQAPTGAIDCHVHLFGPASRYPFHPGSRYISQDALPQTNIALQDTLGLAGAVVVSGGGYGPDTRHLEGVLAVFPDRFRGVALLPDDVTRDHLHRLDRLGVRGARFVSDGHHGALPRLSASVAARIAEFGWHVQFYPSGDDLPRYADQLLALPNDIVLDHFAAVPAAGGTAQAAFECLLRLLDTGRVWVKLSGPMRCTAEDFPYASVTPLAQALVKHAPQRLLWGTDWPHVNMNGRAMPNDGDLFDLLAEWVPDAATRKQILVDNPRAVYGFPG
ncbi:amidohydrolase family protein [Ramlibacter sp. AW1]|uniref:Amidohydrolase family protein n=1 Tax=Ramlibacter aurantiacus TaxID=2801330 RepID=A0A936ZQI2_9BURK|nr:amidohydrolase family protein [Ramlibacter aurantiacus]MBL0421623.1 amidohydrolase family protein [Ramlibacter aurantiacus]